MLLKLYQNRLCRTDAGEERVPRADAEIIVPAELRKVTFENVRIAFFYGYTVVKRDRGSDGAELVEPVRAEPQDIQSEIDLGVCLYVHSVCINSSMRFTALRICTGE